MLNEQSEGSFAKDQPAVIWVRKNNMVTRINMEPALVVMMADVRVSGLFRIKSMIPVPVRTMPSRGVAMGTSMASTTVITTSCKTLPGSLNKFGFSIYFLSLDDLSEK
jgi:hypothetical protein